MARFKLTIEYDGSRYSGWQVQRDAKTVQGCLVDAAEKVFEKKKVVLVGSGRTDSGVHALGQVAHLEVNTDMQLHIINYKMNDLLPYDINVASIEPVSEKFHARHSAVRRVYLYQILKRRCAFGKNVAWWVKDNLDVERMKSAGDLFRGTHDFSSFADKNIEDVSTKVYIESVEIKEHGNLILIRIVGSHFLWKMVRRMVGVLVEVGRGKKNQSDILSYLEKHSTEPADLTAPPSGLFLQKVLYKGEEYDKEILPVLNI